MNLGAAKSLPAQYHNSTNSKLTTTLPEEGGDIDSELVSRSVFVNQLCHLKQQASLRAGLLICGVAVFDRTWETRTPAAEGTVF